MIAASKVTRDSNGRVAQLDGLRAIAVGLVFVWHGLYSSPPQTYFSWWAPGPAGVRLFFVLSGFLITGILLRARTDAERFGTPLASVWWTFYIRRALRIFPLAFAAMLLAALIGIREMRTEWFWYVSYLTNIRVSSVGFAVGIGHFWSLAVEEQFYLVWPALILLAPRRALPAIMMAAIVAAGLFRGWRVAHGQFVPAYVLLTSRLDALAAGGLLALLRERERPVVRPLLILTAVLVSTGAALPIGGLSVILSEWGAIALCGLLVVGAANGFGGLPGRILASRPMVYVGTISYGLYIWHPLVGPTIRAIEQQLDVWFRYPGELGLPLLLAMSSSSLIAASVSWFFFEKPINDIRHLFPYARTTSAPPVPALAGH